MNKALIMALVAVFSVAGCVTSGSTERQIDRQIGYLDSLATAQAQLQDKMAEISEKIAEARQDLEALKAQRAHEIVINETAPTPLVAAP
jgi:outer membrane murein-binding lipoprotein Lpp